jgi:hypothetical protein
MVVEDYNTAVTARKETVRSHFCWIDANPDANPDDNEYAIPDEPEEPQPPIPFLLILLPELITPFYRAIKKFYKKFKPLVYHNNIRNKKSSKQNTVPGLLAKNHKVFNCGIKAVWQPILTTLPTLHICHGP